MVRFGLLLAGSAMALVGCVSIIPEQDVPSALYRIDTVTPSGGLAADLVVREPSSARILGGQGMVIEVDGGGLRLISGAEWAGRLTNLMQYGLIDALSGEGAGTAVTALSGAPGAYELSWRITDMTIIPRGDDGLARCGLSLTLLDGRSRRPIASLTVSEDHPVNGRGPENRASALAAAGRDCVEAAGIAVSAAIAGDYSAAGAGGGTDG